MHSNNLVYFSMESHHILNRTALISLDNPELSLLQMHGYVYEIIPVVNRRTLASVIGQSCIINITETDVFKRVFS